MGLRLDEWKKRYENKEIVNIKNEFTINELALLQKLGVELILRAMELYGYNLKFMVNDTDITTEERSRKQAKLEYTYQQILAIQSEQINNKSDLHDTNTKMAENMLESANILDFDKMIKKA